MKRKCLNLFFVFLLIFNYSFSQDILFPQQVSDTLKVNYEGEYFLSSFLINQNSIRFFTITDSLLNVGFNFDSTTNSITTSNLNLGFNKRFIVKYNSVKIPISKEIYNRKIVQRYDGAIPDSVVKIDLNNLQVSNKEIFGNKLNRNGSILRGITFGSNQDATVNSGLRLQLSGKLSDDIEIVASLTDQNSPLQPEGVTESLEEIEKVFIELKHKNIKGTFGDFYLNEDYGEFVKVNRKLQGLTSKFNYNEQSGFVAYASQRGKYTSNEFLGQDGVQGPYRLYGENNEKEIIVLSGTEKVFINGEEQKRGENNQYTIDYANSTITFTTNKIISKTSRIFVEFEYSDRKFARSFLSGGTKLNLFDNKLKITSSYVSENDNENDPIDFNLSESDLEIISQAGNDADKAFTSGVFLAKEDSNGIRNGVYTKIDTLINNKEFSYYLYAPEKETSIYYVNFSYVGTNNGDYKKVSTVEYQFVGKKLGSYLPVTFLPLPQKKEVANLGISYSPTKNLQISGEISGSNFDPNKLSEIGNNLNQGFAWNFTGNYKFPKLVLADYQLGEIEIKYRDRFIDSKYSSIERMNSVEFNRDYNLENISNSSQILSEGNLQYQISENNKFDLFYGYLKQGENFQSERTNIKYDLNKKSDYSINLLANRTNSIKNGIEGNFNEFKMSGFYSFDFIKPSISVMKDAKNEFIQSGDSLLNISHDYFQVTPQIEFFANKFLNIGLNYSWREDSNPLNNKLVKESIQQSYGFNLDYKQFKEIKTKLDISLQKRNYELAFKKNGLLDNENLVVRSRTQYGFFSNFLSGDLFYSTTTEKAAKLQRIFVPVQVGRGEYIYLGDLNDNGIADEDEFERVNENGNFTTMTVPTDDLFPVVDLRLDSKLRLTFKNIFKYNSFWKTWFAPISTETFFRIDEKSKITNTSKIYLLNQDYFLQDSTTINGSKFLQQDVDLFKNNSTFSLRGRFLQRKFLNLYSNGIESGIKKEKSLLARIKIIREIRNKTEYRLIDDNLISEANKTKNRIAQTEEINTDFSYRPIQNIEVGFKFTVSRTEDAFPEQPKIIDMNSQNLRVTYSLVSKGRIRLEIERRELLADNSKTTIPFEITQGYNLGQNYILRLNADYKISDNLQTTVTYSGKKYSKSDVIHIFRAEARAYF